MKINFILNHKPVEVDVDPSMRLLDLLRDVLNLKGVKEGCGEGACGACTVLVDNQCYNSSLTPVANIINKDILTIEGFKTSREYRIIADAFAHMGGSQCGFCTPGMIMATYGLFLKNPHPNEDEVRIALSGNLCRCTGYQAIVNAVLEASEKGDGLWK